LWGLILVNLAITCKLLILVLRALSYKDFLLKLTPGWEKVVQVAYELALIDVLSLWPVSVFIWILVSFRRADWELWLETDAPATAVGRDKVKGGTGKR
jgi:hypothetical protein